MPTPGDLRIWYIPQVPMKAFERDVPDFKTGQLLLDTIYELALFEYENKVKPDYCNAGGISRWEEDGEGEGVAEAQCAQPAAVETTVVNRYRADMESGLWTFAADAIRFDDKGNLYRGEAPPLPERHQAGMGCARARDPGRRPARCTGLVRAGRLRVPADCGYRHRHPTRHDTAA